MRRQPPRPHLPSPWMDAAGAADYLGLAKGTIHNLTSSRVLPHVRRGRIVRYHREALDKWLARGGCPGRAHLANDQQPHATSRGPLPQTATPAADSPAVAGGPAPTSPSPTVRTREVER